MNFLHVGCGRERKDRTTAGFNTPDWQECGLDIDSAVQPDIVGTITDTALVADGSMNALYSPHNIEGLCPARPVAADYGSPLKAAIFFWPWQCQSCYFQPSTDLRTRRVPLNRLFAMTFLPAVLAACATTEPQSAAASASYHRSGKDKEQKQLNFKLASGVYRCELGQSVEVQRSSQNVNRIELGWLGNRHTLLRQDSSSGLPRYEDRQKGLLWIDLPWKSVLMDVNSGRPLANECKLAPGQTTRG